MSCTCTAAAQTGVAFTIDGTQYVIPSGTYTIPNLIAMISVPNTISAAVNGFRNTATNVSNQGTGATQTINGGEALVSLYGPF